MKEVGQLLKSRRIAKGLSLQEVSAILKISLPILKAIEEGDVSKLPAKAFLRGFIHSYANYLKLDLEEVMGIFAQETEAPSAHEDISFPQEEKQKNFLTGASSFSDFSSKVKLTLVIAFIVLIGSIFFTKKNLIKKNPKAEKTQAKNFYKIPEFQQENNKSKESQKNQKNQKKKKSPRALASTKQKTDVSQKQEARKTSNKKNSTGPASASASASNSNPPSNSKPFNPNSSQKIIVEAFNNLEVNYRLDEGNSNKLTLLPGQIKIFKAKGKITLTLSDGGAASITHNGKRKGVPGYMGDPITLHYPPPPKTEEPKL